MIKIRKEIRDDMKYKRKWYNNENVTKYIGNTIGGYKGPTLKELYEGFDKVEKAKNRAFFTICDNEKPIGWMGLGNICKTNKSANMFLAIGDDNYRGKGIGKIALLWLIDYGFKKRKLHKINLSTMEINISAVNLYKSVGFEIEGVKKDEIFHQGKYYNYLFMAIFNRNQN